MIAPLPSASTAILPANEAGLARLARLLAVKKGFQLYVLVCPEPRERDRLIARLADEPGLAGRPVLRVDLAEYGPSAAAPADVPSLEARLHAEAGADAIVHLVNCDGWLKPDRIAELNLHRNALAAQVPASLLWWLPEVTVTELARGAPDVWSWRSGVVAFEGAGEVAEPIGVSPPVARNWFEVRGMSREEKQARLAELEQVLPRIKSAELRRDLLLELADILVVAGRLDEALHVLRQQLLPMLPGDLLRRAITLARVADIQATKGALDEALSVLGDEVLPAVEKLGNVREKAVTQGKIADILQARGELDEALRLRIEEVLPVYEKLGDVREKAVAQGRIADILMARGELDEALRTLREEVLPAFEKLGDARELLVARANLGISLLTRNAPGDRAETHRLFDISLADARRLKLPQETAIIESWLADLDDPA